MIIDKANIELIFKGFKEVYNQNFEAAEAHVDDVAMRVESVSSEEEYGWLGQFPALREWVGDRVINAVKAHGFSIKNKKFESTITVERDHLSDDKAGIYKPLFSEMGRVSKQHPDSLIFSLLKSGATTKCFDGKNFFDTVHITGVPGELTVVAANYDNGGVAGSPFWYLLDCSRGVKPIIWQEREGYEFQTVTNNSDYHTFMTDKYHYGIRARVNCGFGLWQLAYASNKKLYDAGDTSAYEEARARMMDFRGDRGQLLGIRPTHLVVPPSLEGDARRLLKGVALEQSVWTDSVKLIVTPHVA